MTKTLSAPSVGKARRWKHVLYRLDMPDESIEKTIGHSQYQIASREHDLAHRCLRAEIECGDFPLVAAGTSSPLLADCR